MTDPMGSQTWCPWPWGCCVWVPAWVWPWLRVCWRRMVGRSCWQQSHGCISLCGGGAVAQIEGPRLPLPVQGTSVAGTVPQCPMWHRLLAPGPSLGKRGLGRQDFPFRAALGLGEAPKQMTPGVIYASLSALCPAMDDLTDLSPAVTRACGTGSSTAALAAAVVLGVLGVRDTSLRGCWQRASKWSAWGRNSVVVPGSGQWGCGGQSCPPGMAEGWGRGK